MAYADVNGTRIAWQQMGSGPNLVLVHGLAASRAFWFAHAMQLRAHYTVTLFDLPGHGYSARPDSGYDSASLGRLVLGLMDTLQIADASRRAPPPLTPAATAHGAYGCSPRWLRPQRIFA